MVPPTEPIFLVPRLYNLSVEYSGIKPKCIPQYEPNFYSPPGFQGTGKISNPHEIF